jgi:indolepyruvate ferredoxin oxidoreductase beta subunit
MELKLILTGLGGQGVVFLTRLLSHTAVTLGYPVMVSETHGMSQRGGSVISHLKVGGSDAPLIQRGTADIRQGGTVFVNSENGLPPEVEKRLQQLRIQLFCLPASQIAIDLGAAAIANTVMAGFACPFPIEALRQAVSEIAPRGRELNLQALETGFQARSLP